MRDWITVLCVGLCVAALVAAVGCKKEDDGDPEDDFAVFGDDDADDDVSTPDDDEEDDDGGHWVDDDDDEDSDDDDSDDDSDDDTDDDADDDTDDDADDDTEAWAGWVVGEALAGSKAFAGKFEDGEITDVTVPDGGNVVLNGVDFYDASWGLAVGWNTQSDTGVLYKIEDDVWTNVPINIPSLVGEWALIGLDVFDDRQAILVGKQTVTAVGTFGIVLRYDHGVLTRMTLPSVSSNFRLNAVSMSSASVGWAVGANDDTGKGVILGWAGSTWFAAPYTMPDNEVEWYDVATVSNAEAFVVGVGKPDGELNVRGEALHYANLTWTKNYNFPEDGQNWRLLNVTGLGSGDAIAFVSKFDKMEHWRYDSGAWERRSYGDDLPTNGILTGASLINANTGLVGFMLTTANAGLVFERVGGDWDAVSTYPDNMGRVRDVAVVISAP